MTYLELRSQLEDYTIDEITKAYKAFNPEFFSDGHEIPDTHNGWVDHLENDINNYGHSLEDIFYFVF